MSDDKTLERRAPMPERPRTGWQAWEVTVGYIATQYHPDATLQVEAYRLSGSDRIGWTASLAWGERQEQVKERMSIAAALRDLWYEVNRHHVIFKSLEAAVRRPENYPDSAWLDSRTADVIERLVRVANTVLEDDWLVLFIYRPVEDANARVQARLLAKGNSVQRGGRGPVLRDAARSLYSNASTVFTMNLKRD